MATSSDMAWLRLHAHYREGNLLASGGLMDQPAAYLEGVELVRDQLASREG